MERSPFLQSIVVHRISTGDHLIKTPLIKDPAIIESVLVLIKNKYFYDTINKNLSICSKNEDVATLISKLSNIKDFKFEFISNNSNMNKLG